jgi:hypothetical protein
MKLVTLANHLWIRELACVLCKSLVFVFLGLICLRGYLGERQKFRLTEMALPTVTIDSSASSTFLTRRNLDYISFYVALPFMQAYILWKDQIQTPALFCIAAFIVAIAAAVATACCLSWGLTKRDAMSPWLL